MLSKLKRVEIIAKAINIRQFCKKTPPKPFIVVKDKEKKLLIGDVESHKQILEVVALEKTRDASNRGELSKECTKLSKKSRFRGGFMRVRDDEFEKDVTWETYQFEAPEPIKDPPSRICPVPVPTTPVDAPSKPPLESGKLPPPPPPTGPRPIRQEPGKVVLGFIPEEYWLFFIPKTGVTGFYTFLFTVGTYLVSKEIYVLEHNYYNGLSMAILCWASVVYVGAPTAKLLDKLVDEYENEWAETRISRKKWWEEDIKQEIWLQHQMDGQTLVMDAKRENVQLQLEEEFRKRQMHVHAEVTRILNYQVAVANVHTRIKHRNLVDYVTREVMKSITPDMQDKLINYSLDQIVLELDRLNLPKK